MAYAAFWIGLFTFLIIVVFALINHPVKSPQNEAELRCVQNNGVPIHNSWGDMMDCKIYKK